ncbi:MAG: hypothetical protein DCC67_17165 [Planctomycetota bacterium]|nr:MAG: hypothetical protein DCC67_17165 [Planctomycetota bacterium]
MAFLLVGAAMGAPRAGAQFPVTDFSYFESNELYASWASPSTTIVSGDESYSITATGYGSNYKFIGVVAATGATHVELEVTLSGPPQADGQLGPIISFVDDDGSYYNYAWFGQTLGDHVLRAPLAAPTWISNPGTTPGLNLDAIPHMHMQLDPAQFGSQGAYTIEWKNLTLITAAPGDFDADLDVDGADFLLWQRSPAVGSLDDFKANFGTVSPGVAIVAVPEPTAAVIALLAAAALLVRTRRS